VFSHARAAAIYARIFSASHPDDASPRNAWSFAVLTAGLISLQSLSLICAAIKV
jgi:hypothetical protein